MAYCVTNYKTKKEFLADLKAKGKLEAFQPGGICPLREGANVIEGPHYPQPHKWYVAVTIRNGFVVQAK